MIQQVALELALSKLAREALRVVAGLAVVVLLALAFAVSSLFSLFGRSYPGQPVQSASADAIPPDQLLVMQQAAAESSCGLSWQVLAAVAKVESDFGRNMATSSAGAIGYGQFLPDSWAVYGRGSNPYDYRDALPAMARYLCDNGAGEDLRRAVWAYNHADWYVDEVLAVAYKYGLGLPGSTSARVVDVARSQMGMPYVWGGASTETSFDCSGLVQWSYRQVGVHLPRTAQEQYDATQRIARDELQPGDLVFFAHTYAASYPITHVGIYLGAGWMLNAPTTGDVVREMPVFSGYWGTHYGGAGRV